MKKIKGIVKDGNITTRVKFKLMEVMEMRENNWKQIKQRVSQVTTIDQVCGGNSHLEMGS